MTQRPTESLDADYFARIYADEVDPWGFATSDYERDKYADTLASLPRERYANAFEIGCAIGVLSARLAERTDALLGVDLNEQVLAEARRRNSGQPHVRFERMMFPRERPDDAFDLIVVSEVAYYWAGEDFALAQRHIRDMLRPGGHLILVHYTPEATDYPMTGDEVHERFFAFAKTCGMSHVRGHRRERYRLDVFEG